MQYFADHMFDGQQIRANQLITVENGKISSFCDARPEQADVVFSGLVAPGFVDVQVNGGGGKLFNNEPNIDTLKMMSYAHQRYGTTAMLPTLITDDITTMQLATEAVKSACENNIAGIIGVHFEGPHLSSPKKGIHPERHIRHISDKELSLFMRKDIGQVCVTLAPENVPIDIIKELVQANVKVCLGHSNATSEQTFSAIEAGAQGFTHLFNAMSPLQSREAGMVGAALLNDQTYCGLIVDHQHVDLTSCKLAIKCKSPQQIMLVTDAMSHVGSDQTELHFAGMDIVRDGEKLTIEGGRLAGSVLDMATAVRNTINDLNCSLQEALTMASTTPAAFLSLSDKKGTLRPGADADWVVLSEDLHVQATYIAGRKTITKGDLCKQ